MRFFTSAGMPLAVLAIGIAATTVAVRALNDSASAQDQQRFDRAAQQMSAALERRLSEEASLLRGVARMMALEEGYAGPEKFVPFLDAFRPQERPGTRLFGYSRRMATHQLPALEEEIRRRYNRDFAVHPEGVKRPEHFVVAMTFPNTKQWRWWNGLDMSAEACYRAAIDRAEQTGAPAATAATMSASPEGRPSQPVFVVMSPVFNGAKTPAAQSSSAKLIGVTFVSYRATDLLESVYRAIDLPGVACSVRDGAPGAEGGLSLYRSAEFDGVAAAPAFSTDLPVACAGRTWTLSVRAADSFRDPAAAGLPRKVAIFGGLASVLVAGLVALHGRLRVSIVRRTNVSESLSRDATLAQQRLELVLEALGVGMWSCELPDGRIHWDDRARAMHLLADAADVTVLQALDRVHSEDRPRLKEALGSAVATGGSFDVTYRVISASGSETHWLRSVGRPERASGTGAAGRSFFSGVTIDITAREWAWLEADRARHQAEEARAEAERAARAKDEFLATTGHELRAPLSAILGWAQLLRRQGDRLDPAVDEGLAVIERNARAQDRLVADLLDVGLIDAGAVRLNIELVDLAAAARSAVEAARPAAEAKEIDLQLSLDLSAGPVRGDPDRLQQVVANLLTNALKFTPQGGRVRVIVARDADRVVLSVCDSGEGIAPEFLPHVFDRFRQQDASTARRHGGLGLGLAIVRHLVELHDGRIGVESAGAGKGATFTVELPAAFPAATSTGRHRDWPDAAGDRSGSHTPKRPPADALFGVKVLVVDDDLDALSAAKGVLSAAGARVIGAANALEALAVVLREHPHVIMCDIAMPEVDGFEFLRRLRGLSPEAGNATPAAALTGFARPEDRLRALAGGFQAHVAKPVDADELVLTVLRLSGRAVTGESASRGEPRST